MAKINQLSFDVANLIAAGEVVERPASAVKELLENAIDAGATEITVETRRGGSALIRVADNGSGMESEDLPIAIRRHATSKIRDAEDLSAIGTLGFRGEALAATSAVSRLSIITKTKDANSGTILVAEAGSVTDISEIGCADGTTVLVENLFENVPARRKFLKKDATETQAIGAVIEKIALSRPDVAITFLADGVKKFSTPGDGELLHVLHALFGREMSSRLISVSGEGNGVSVSGFVGRPDNAKGNRNHQNVFINGRYVRSKTVLAAIERAFTSYMAPERFPVAALFLTIPTFAVDVNVHPAKLEVKFSDERAVFEAVYYAIRSALEDDVSRPYLELRKGSEAEKKHKLAHSFEMPAGASQLAFPEAPSAPSRPVTPTPVAPRPTTPARTVGAPSSAQPMPSASRVAASDKAPPERTVLSPEESLRIIEGATSDAAPSKDGETLAALLLRRRDEERAQLAASAEEDAPKSVSTIPKEDHTAPIPRYTLHGVAFNCYVIVELEDERLLIIDQHAAHERILFEALKKQRKEDKRILSVELLLPISLLLTREEAAAAEEHKNELFALGFAYDVKESTVYLTAIPDEITPPEAERLFASLCDDIANGVGDVALAEEKRRERLLYQIACKAAIKGGRRYDSAHIDWLVREVLSLPDVTVCPHGRPIAFYLSKGELDRRFDRIK